MTPLYCRSPMSVLSFGQAIPGQNGGNAILDVLSGAKSDAGRLPVTQYPAGYTSEVSIFNPTPGPNTKFPGRTYAWSLGMRFFRLATDYITLILHSPGQLPYSIKALIKSSSKNGYLENVNFATLSISDKNIGRRANLASYCGCSLVPFVICRWLVANS